MLNTAREHHKQSIREDMLIDQSVLFQPIYRESPFDWNKYKEEKDNEVIYFERRKDIKKEKAMNKAEKYMELSNMYQKT